jgi:RNA polymerase sigma-70 factor, ECF subfamily
LFDHAALTRGLDRKLTSKTQNRVGQGLYLIRRHRIAKTVMPLNSDVQATELLRAWSQGDESARDRLLPLVYDELHRLARRYMRQERPDHTLQPTALVNEAYLRLIDVNRIEWRNRTHFLALAAQTMRRILVESARNRRRQKRGGGAVRESIDAIGELPKPEDRDVIALSDALNELAAFDERMSQVVELRFFGGLSVDETADVLNLSPETVMRDWKTAKAWLLRELRQPKAGERP